MLEQTPAFISGRSSLPFQDEPVMFVDGCFWHGCPKHATQPKGNAVFWRDKLEANKTRDRKVNRLLHAKGWRVLRIWEHDMKSSRQAYTVRRVERTLHSF
jgi:DNA mismatch endonuclease (patch repair protein)